MLFKYSALDQKGNKNQGSIDAISLEVAISSLQKRGLIISSINPADKGSFFERDFVIFNGVSSKDIVVLSRQMSTLFQAQVSALRVFRLIATEVENKTLARVLTEVADDLQGGSPISRALSKKQKKEL